jgi:DNA invertase Pin-like site-specific DNA recombinase
MKRAIVLIRVSTEQQAGNDREGLQAQRHACKRLVQQHALTVGHTVELVDVSGAAIMATAEMQEIMRLLYSGQYSALVVREFSRALRPQNYDYLLFQAMMEQRVTLYTETATIEPWTPQGRMMVAMHGVIAANELDTIRQRMMGGKEALRRAGKWAAGAHCLPRGVSYDRQTGKFSYNAQAAAVRSVFQRFLAGDHNYDALAKRLGMARNTARNVLSNPIYSGYLVYDRCRDERRRYKHEGNGHQDRPKVARKPEDVIRRKVLDPPLVTEAEFNRVQQLIAEKVSRNLRARVKVGHFVYNGFVWCARCGARYHTFRNQFQRHYYVCKNRKAQSADASPCRYSRYLNRDKLEAILDDVIVGTLASPAALRRVAKEAKEAAEARTDKRSAERGAKLVEQLAAKRERVLDMYADGTIAKADRDKRLAAVAQQLQAAQAQLAAAQPTAPAFDVKALASLFEPLVAWRTLQRSEKRQLLAALQPRFILKDYKVLRVELAGAVASCNSGSPLKMAP